MPLRKRSAPDLVALLDGFGAADPEASATYCEEVCPLCHQHAAKPIEQRDRMCRRERCRLRHPREFRAEQGWVRATREEIPAWPHRLDPAAVKRVLLHIARDNAVTPILARAEGVGEDGRESWHLETYGETLRGLLHAALLDLALLVSGDLMNANVASMSIAAIEEQARAARGLFDEGLRGFAAELRDRGVSDRQIAKKLGLPGPKTIRDWHGPRAEWRAGRR